MTCRKFVLNKPSPYNTNFGYNLTNVAKVRLHAISIRQNSPYLALGELALIQENGDLHTFASKLDMKAIVGIRQKEGSSAFQEVDIAPCFFRQLTYAKGSTETVQGKISVKWERKNTFILVTIDVPKHVKAWYKGKALPAGRSVWKEAVEEDEQAKG